MYYQRGRKPRGKGASNGLDWMTEAPTAAGGGYEEKRMVWRREDEVEEVGERLEERRRRGFKKRVNSPGTWA